MCLIIYSPDAVLPERTDFVNAARDNPDGIGIMSERGIQKFIGKRRVKRAWKACAQLSEAGVPFGIHFRWTTHGATSRDNVHPFMTATGHHVMHNGVLSQTTRLANGDKLGRSDTAIYVSLYMSEISDIAPVARLLGDSIGTGNKFLIMDDKCEFHIINEDCGLWVGACWFSNDWSFDYSRFDWSKYDCDARYWPESNRVRDCIGYADGESDDELDECTVYVDEYGDEYDENGEYLDPYISAAMRADERASREQIGTQIKYLPQPVRKQVS